MKSCKFVKTNELPDIPQKRYFTIGEVASLCSLKPHVLRYWEQEFPQLAPNKRRGNRRYYMRNDIEVVRQIRELLYEKRFTIDGAKSQINNRKQKQSKLPVDNVKSHPQPEAIQKAIAELKELVVLFS